jgi:hypothetical protein
MKWIGQHIWDFISRFRSDVYLDSPTAGGSDPDKFLGIDSDNKIIYRTGAEVFSDIGAAAGDITGVSFTTDDTGSVADTAGSADFTIAGGEGIDTTSAGATVTITAELASDSNKGVASFESDEFTVSSGVVNLKNAVSRIYGATTIKLIPSDFIINDDVANKVVQFADGGTTGLKPGAAGSELWAFMDIPEGKKATHLDVYTSINRTIGIYEIDINASGIGVAKGVGTSNTQLDFTDVDATATNYLGIYILTTATTDRVYGGLLTIADQ